MTQNDCAPIALFTYNRLRHTQQTVAALQANDLAAASALYVFSDGPGDPAARAAVNEVRQYLRSLRGFKSVEIIERESNLGLAKSIIAGVGAVCSRHGRIIVLEDDLCTSPSFLRYMNDALNLYEQEPAVGSIHGYWYPVDEACPESFFLRGASCWGWATWARAWADFEPDGRKLLAQLEARNLTRAFDLDGAMRYTRMLRMQIAGTVDSWAIRWHAANFLANRMQLSPGRSLVTNIGFDGSGTHSGTTDAYATSMSDRPIDVRPIPVEESTQARAALIRYYLRSRPTLARRIAWRLRRVVGF